jgi:hypothetical protein
MNKMMMLLMGLSLLILLGISASATIITDADDDVLHWNGSNYMNWSWNVGDRPEVDIIEIDYEVGSRLTISMKVAGTISNEKAWYHLWFNTSDAYYHLSYMPDEDSEPFATAFPLNFDSMSLEDLMNYTEPNIETSVNGNTITATIDWVTDQTEMDTFWAWAQQWDNEGETWSDYYIDFAPNEYSYFGEYEDYYEDGSNDSTNQNSDSTNTTNQDTNDGSNNSSPQAKTNTPGFELIILLAAVIVFVLIRKHN